MSSSKRKVFITGGTGTLGQSLIETFFKNGYEVFFQYFSNDNVAVELEKKFSSTSFKIDFAHGFDLPEIDFDIIINNAGINISDSLAHLVSDKDWQETLNINVTVPFKICKFYLPKMIEKKWGRIININSIYGIRGVDYNSPYVVSKHALSGLTKSIAKEYGMNNITCNEICPGAIESELMNRIAVRTAQEEKTTPEIFLKEVASNYPLNRLVNPIEVAVTVLFLASEISTYINGVSIPVDGGLTC